MPSSKYLLAISKGPAMRRNETGRDAQKQQAKEEKRASDEKSEEKGPDGVNLRGGEEKKRLLGQATARQLGPAAQVFARLCLQLVFVSGGRWGIAAADLAWPTAKRPQKGASHSGARC